MPVNIVFIVLTLSVKQFNTLWHVFSHFRLLTFQTMKKIFTYLGVLAVLTSFTTTTGIDEIVTALRSGNANLVAKYFDSTVEITLPEKSNSYSKSQAEVVLKDFFNNNPVTGFNIIHKGENAGSQYCIGTLLTKTGNFRTTVFLKLKGDKQMLQEIRFENR